MCQLFFRVCSSGGGCRNLNFGRTQVSRLPCNDERQRPGTCRKKIELDIPNSPVDNFRALCSVCAEYEALREVCGLGPEEFWGQLATFHAGLPLMERIPWFGSPGKPASPFLGPLPESITEPTDSSDEVRKAKSTPEFKFKCPFPVCTKRCRTEKTLESEHLRAEHSWPEKNLPFMCQWPGCGKRFLLRNSIESHHQLHEAQEPEKVGTEMPGRPCLYGVAVDLPRHAWVPLVLASGSYEKPVRQETFQEMRKNEPLLWAFWRSLEPVPAANRAGSADDRRRFITPLQMQKAGPLPYETEYDYLQRQRRLGLVNLVGRSELDLIEIHQEFVENPANRNLLPLKPRTVFDK